jgi:GNAT superfamily N-acetyltransferase
VRIRRATPGDVAAVVDMRYGLTRWLSSIGTDQWTSDLGIDRAEVERRVSASIAEGTTWIAYAEEEVVGSIAIDQITDGALWSVEELAESVILHRMMVRREFAGRQIGTRMISWAEQIALIENRKWIRLDAWDTNEGLHAYYLSQGFERVRHVKNHRFPSATLFQRAVRTSAPLPSGS